MHRDPEKLKEQAHVYVPSTPKVPKTECNEDEKPRPSPIVDPFKRKFVDPIAIIKAENKGCTKNQDDMETEKESKITNVNTFKVEKELCSSNLIKEEETPMEVDNKNEMETNQNAKEIIKREQKDEYVSSPNNRIFFNCNVCMDPFLNNFFKILQLGKREELLFNLADVKSVPQDDIPDNYYEPTEKDLKILLRDAKEKQAKLENFPLLTTAQRRLEESRDKLYRLRKYKQSIIRIRFPNQFVLQALFAPVENVQTVKDFIKTYLEQPDSDFTLCK